MAIAVRTRSFDKFRTGANLQETVQTPARLRAQGIAKRVTFALPGDLRGTEGMALMVPGLTMRDGLQHNVLYLASMSNDVRAFDAQSGQLLWQVRIGNPIPGTRAMDMYAINDHWGILSTPVIDTKVQAIYCVVMESPTGQIGNSAFTLHALDLIDGSARAAPLPLNPVTYQPPNGLPLQTMGSVPRKQRCALAFDTQDGVDTVYVANGSFNEDASTNRGWLIACDVTGIRTGGAMALGAAVTTTSRYSGGGLWQGGQGPAIDDAGRIYIGSGNGAFDGVTDFGECLLQATYTPKKGSTPGKLVWTGWAPPFTDTGRENADPTLPSDSLIPAAVDTTPDVPATSNMDDPGDEDLNSGGLQILPAARTGFSRDYAGIAGKDGAYQVVDCTKFPRIPLAWFDPALRHQVWNSFALPPTYVTFFPGAMTPMPTGSFTEMQTTYGGRTHHMHATPVMYRSPAYAEGVLLYFGGENGPVKTYLLTEPTPGKLAIQWVADAAEIASAECGPPGGMPGTMMTLSANGAEPDTGVLWCCQPYGDANKTIAAGRFLAYAADQFVNGAMVKLFDSQDWGWQFTHNKFDLPTCIDGWVYLPTYSGTVEGLN